MQKIVTYLWFDYQAEEAATFYTSLFKNSGLTGTTHDYDAETAKKGRVMTVEFKLEGQDFIALNGGPQYTFSEAVSLFVKCQTQQEIDELWHKLSEGGEERPCGWLKDKYGVFWQISPANMLDLLRDPDPEKANRVMQAMLQMKKIDSVELERVYAQQ
jgi:predicted 3-demethylubiquinone-9 3-methyltransferase (glyoxalase superfamily)